MDRYQFSEEALDLLEHTPVPLAVYQFLNKRVITLALSLGFCELFGYEDRAQAYHDMDTDMYRDTHPDDAARIADAALRFATEGEHYEVIYRTRVVGTTDYRIVHAIGKHVYLEGGVRLAYVWYTDEGSYTVKNSSAGGNLNASLTRALHQESLLTASYYDYLTGLPSMTYFFELAEAGRDAMLREGRQPALLFIDLNGMKYYNRKYGFAQGDELLRSFSRLLTRHFSNENCSRLGQDHFAVFTLRDGLEDTLHQLFEECKGLNEGRTLPIRVGIYWDEHHDADVASACDRAKFACDVDRSAYLSRYRYFDESMQVDMGKHQYVLDNLDQALEERWIVPFYQPIVRTASGKVCDEEALARWIDPEKGLLTPFDFIGDLEDAKLVYKVDLYMVDRVLEDLHRKREAGLNACPVSVNLSRSDFESCDMVEEIRRRVDESGLERRMINIEITESVVGRDLEFIREQVQRFHDLGFHVWMDDFGSGYSSLDVLQSISFDLIKFDMRFMQQFDNTEKSRIILTELMKMALNLGIETVCEGVERRDQLEFLHEIGCTKLQGFYFCRPISLETIFERYRRGQQIGPENLEEQPYYAALGAINLYDPSVVTHTGAEQYRHLFNTIPMSILELQGRQLTVVRCNESYREFMKSVIGVPIPEHESMNYRPKVLPPESFLQALEHHDPEDGWMQCPRDPRFQEDIISFVREIARNPVNGARAFEVVVLAVMVREPGESVDGKES